MTLKSTQKAAPKAPLIISYTRFSTPKQAWGDGQRRQVEQSKKWAEERNLKIDDSLADRGVSAFRGSNTKAGTALGSLLHMAEQKEIPKGSVLLVENLDRLSRDQVRKAMSQFLDLINAGLKIVTLADGHEYSEDKCDTMELMMSVMVMGRAHEESAIKSHRSKAAWVNKRNNASSKIMSEKMPTWLKVVKNKIVLDEGMAKTIRKGFQLAIDGHSKTSICKTLSFEGVKWSWSFWHHVFNGRSVIGECQPYLHPTDGTSNKQPACEPLVGYYPAVVSEDTWLRAGKALKSYRLSTHRSGRRGDFINLFGGLAFDAGDGSPLKVQYKVNRKNGFCTRRYCSTMAVEGRSGASKFVGFPLYPFEMGFLLPLAESIAPKQTDDTAERIEALEARIEAVDAKAEQVENAAMEDGGNMSAVTKLLAKLEKQKADLIAERDELKTSKAGGTAVEAIASLPTEMAANATDQRLKARSILQRLFKRVDVVMDRVGKTRFSAKIVAQKIDGETYEVNLTCKIHRDINQIECTSDKGPMRYFVLPNYYKRT